MCIDSQHQRAQMVDSGDYYGPCYEYMVDSMSQEEKVVYL